MEHSNLFIDDLLNMHSRVQLLHEDFKKCLARTEGLQQEIASAIHAEIVRRSCLDEEWLLTPCPPAPDDIPLTRFQMNQPQEDNVGPGAEAVCSHRTHSSASSLVCSSLPSLESVDTHYLDKEERPSIDPYWDRLPLGQRDESNSCDLRIFQILHKPDAPKGNQRYKKWCTACGAHLSGNHRASERHLEIMSIFNLLKEQHQEDYIWSYLDGRWRKDAVAQVF